jgi:hypothetical protein
MTRQKFREYEIEEPADQSFETLLDWSNNVYADLCEGQYPGEVGWFMWQWITGFSDFGSDLEREAFRHLSRRISDLLRAREEGLA